jgi:arginine decarboxylase
VSTQMRPAGGEMTAFAQQSSRVSAFIYAVVGDPGDPPAGHRALTALTRFVASVRSKNPAVPIYLFGEQLSAVALPPPVLKEIDGFVNAFEDSVDFVAHGIARAAQAYLDALAPPFFKALTTPGAAPTPGTHPATLAGPRSSKAR